MGYVDRSITTYAESVIALMEPEPVVREAGRVLCSGGKFALNERTWRPGLSTEQVQRINQLSVEIFGIPAATPTPLDRDGWQAILERNGFDIDSVAPVAELLSTPSEQESRFRARLHPGCTATGTISGIRSSPGGKCGSSGVCIVTGQPSILWRAFSSSLGNRRTAFW